MSEPIPEPAPEGEPAPEPAPDGGEPAPAAWAPSQEEWTATQQTLGAVIQALTPAEQATQLDPFAEDFQTQLDGYLSQRLAGYDAFQQQVALEQGEAEAVKMLGEIVGDQPFLIEGSQQKARELANTYFNQLAQQHGATPQTARAALEQAVTDVRTWEIEVGKAYQARESSQINTILGARPEAGTNINGAAQQLVVTPGGPMGVLRKYTQGTG